LAIEIADWRLRLLAIENGDWQLNQQSAISFNNPQSQSKIRSQKIGSHQSAIRNPANCF